MYKNNCIDHILLFIIFFIIIYAWLLLILNYIFYY